MHLSGSDDTYVLEADSGQSMTLTGREAAQLVDIARQIRDRLLLQRTQRYEPVHTIEVSNVTVRIDALHTHAVLVLADQNGIEAAYVLSLEQTKSVRDMLTRKITQIEQDIAASGPKQ